MLHLVRSAVFANSVQRGDQLIAMAKRSAESKASPKVKAMKSDTKAAKLDPLFQLVDMAQIGETSKSMLVSMAPHCLGNSPHEFQLKLKEMLKGVFALVE